MENYLQRLLPSKWFFAIDGAWAHSSTWDLWLVGPWTHRLVYRKCIWLFSDRSHQSQPLWFDFFWFNFVVDSWTIFPVPLYLLVAHEIDWTDKTGWKHTAWVKRDVAQEWCHRKNGKSYPTNALMILLGLFPHCTIKCARFKGTTMSVFTVTIRWTPYFNFSCLSLVLRV